MDYWIALASSPAELWRIVNSAIEQGWRPQGGLAITFDAKIYCQAMVREHDEKAGTGRIDRQTGEL